MSAKPESDTFDPFIERIAERVAAVMAKTPAKIFEAEMARRLAASLHEDGTLKSLTQFGVGHNRGPPEDGESAVFDIPGFCKWANVSRSTFYEMQRAGTGPKWFKAGAAVRISRRAAREWLLEREAAAAKEPETV
jgi:predicted DNA-binding transcriptional regulator AlpA